MKTMIILLAVLLCISSAGRAATPSQGPTATSMPPPCATATSTPPAAATVVPTAIIRETPMPTAQREVPPSAAEVVKDACAEAAASHKKVMILFHASWCRWCHKLDTLMASPECKPLFDQSYVIRHLTIAESPEKKNLENPGAEELYEKYADQNSGIPFFLIMAADGSVIADSRIKPAGAKPGSSGANIGYPGTKEEITYFMRVLHETTSLTSDQLKTIRAQLAKSSRPGF